MKSTTADIHLSTYFSIDGLGPEEIRSNLRILLGRCEKMILRERSPSFVEEFMRPIEKLVNNPDALVSSHGSWGLHRTIDQFFLKRLPFAVRPLKVLSRSFHVKPLLKWQQMNRSANVLEIHSDGAKLHRVDLQSVIEISRLKFDGEIDQSGRLSLEYFEGVDRLLADYVTESDPLILAGSKALTSSFRSVSGFPTIHRTSLEIESDQKSSTRLKQSVQQLLKNESHSIHKRHLRSLNRSYERGLVESDLHEIARSVVASEVERLYIAEDQIVWGLVERETGALKIHPFQLNCEDEDILDDLSEIAIKNGAEVFVLPSQQMPEAEPMLAMKKTPRKTTNCVQLGFPRKLRDIPSQFAS